MEFSTETVQDLFLSYNATVNINAILSLIRQICNYLGKRIPENELQDWGVFDKDCVSKPSNLDEISFGN